MEYTVKERIIAHLQVCPPLKEFTGTSDRTAVGIAQAIGKGRAHASLVLNRLLNEGLADYRACRIPEQHMKVRCWFLTPDGGYQCARFTVNELYEIRQTLRRADCLLSRKIKIASNKKG